MKCIYFTFFEHAKMQSELYTNKLSDVTEESRLLTMQIAKKNLSKRSILNIENVKFILILQVPREEYDNFLNIAMIFAYVKLKN